MTIAIVPRGIALGLPQTLGTAQEAIYLPYVQEKMRKLSEFKLGIFIGHAHDERTGEFDLLPDCVTQAESSLKVFFQRGSHFTRHTDRFLPFVGTWRAGAASVAAVYEMV